MRTPTTDDWKYLAKKTRWVPLIFYRPDIRSVGGSIVCRVGAIRYVGAVICLVFGLGLLTLAWLDAQHFVATWLTLPLCIGFGVFLLWGAFTLLRNQNYLAWTPGIDTIKLSRDTGWTVRQFEFSKNDVQPRLRIADHKTTNVQYGTSILAFVPVAHPELEVILARDQQGGAIQPLFERLSEFFGGAVKDETLTTIAFPNGISHEISRLPISNASASFSTMKLRFPTPDQAEFKPSLAAKFIWGIFLCLGLMGIAMAVGSFVQGQWAAAVICFLVGGAFAAFGWLGPRGGIATSVVADRLRGTLTFEFLRAPATYPLQDILAVQLCSRYVSGESDYTTFEINLVLNGPEITRKNILSNAAEKRVRADARRLAEFLNKPLLDHA